LLVKFDENVTGTSYKGKGRTTPVQAWTGPEGLGLTDFKKIGI